MQPSRRPSPSLVISFIALAVAISGTAVALPGHNSVRTDDIKKRAVTASKIANNAVKTSKISDGAVTGAKLATDAVSAAKIADGTITGTQVANNSLSDTQASDYKILGSSFIRVTATEAANLADAQAAAPEVALFSRGTTSLYAKCFRDTTAGEIRGEIYARTTVDGALLVGSDDLPNDSATLLNVATLEMDRELDTENVVPADAADINANEGGVFAPDGSAIKTLTTIAVKQGTIPTGNGAFGDGNVCLFHGAIFGETA